MSFYILFWLWNIVAVLTQVKIYPESKATVTVNAMLTFRCVYTGHQNLSICNFWRNGTVIAILLFPNCTYTPRPLYNYSCPGRQECSASILNTSVEENGVKWKCEVRATGDSNYIQSPETEVSIAVPIDSVTMVVPETSTVTVREHSEVEIKCRTSGGIPAANITWYKHFGTFRDSSVDLEITSHIESTTSTINNFIEVTSTLRYSPPRNENGWRIYCKASNVLGQTVLSTPQKLFLDVTYPPELPVIIGYHDESEYSVIENKQGRLSCSVTGGNPAPTLTWNCFNNGTLETTPDGTVTKTHTWTAQRNQDRTCTCRSFHYSGERTVPINIKVMYPPTQPIFKMNSAPVSATVKIIRNNPLSVIGNSLGIPSPSYSWTYPNGTVTIGQELSVRNVQNSGTYTCDVNNFMNSSNGLSERGSIASSLDVQVLYPPYVEPFHVYPAAEGSELSVECKTRQGNPAIATFTWKRKFNNASDNTWLDIPDSYIYGGKLLKININRSDAGTYNCTAFNLMKPTTDQEQIGSNSQIFLLTVLYEASITSFFIDGHQGQTRVTVDENDGGIQFTCEVDSNPSSTVKILFNGDVKKETSNTKQISMILSNAACLDSGEYTCKGDNQYGHVSMKSIKLFVNCSPRSLYQMRQNITSALHVPVTLSFTALAYPHPGTKGFAWFKENGVDWYPVLSNADLHISASASQSNLTISNVSNADFGRYRLTVTNEIGSFVQYLILEEDLAENEGLSENSQRCTERAENLALITGISLGVVVAVLAVYATSITILYKRNIAGKDKQVVVKESTQKTYVNIAYKPNVQENEINDGTTEAEGDEARQYTDLVGYSRDDRTTYEVLQGL